MLEPIGKGDAIEGRIFFGTSYLQGHGKAAAGVEALCHLSKAFELFAVAGRQADIRFDALLPPSVEKQSLLGRKAEIVFIPLAIFIDAEIGKQFAHIFSLLARHRDIVRRPRICGNVVFSPAGVAASLAVHFQKYEVGEAALLQSPGGAQSSHASTYDHQRYADLLLGGRELSVVAKKVAHLECIVFELAFDRTVALDRESHQRRRAQRAEFAPCGLQWLISRHSRS